MADAALCAVTARRAAGPAAHVGGAERGRGAACGPNARQVAAKWREPAPAQLTAAAERAGGGVYGVAARLRRTWVPGDSEGPGGGLGDGARASARGRSHGCTRARSCRGAHSGSGSRTHARAA
jgi:hypothetical protein